MRLIPGLTQETPLGKRGRLYNTCPCNLFPTHVHRMWTVFRKQGRLFQALEIAQANGYTDKHPSAVVFLATANRRVILGALGSPFGQDEQRLNRADIG